MQSASNGFPLTLPLDSHRRRCPQLQSFSLGPFCPSRRCLKALSSPLVRPSEEAKLIILSMSFTTSYFIKRSRHLQIGRASGRSLITRLGGSSGEADHHALTARTPVLSPVDEHGTVTATCMLSYAFSPLMGDEQARTCRISPKLLRASFAHRCLPMSMWRANHACQEHQPEDRKSQGAAASLVAGPSESQEC